MKFNKFCFLFFLKKSFTFILFNEILNYKISSNLFNGLLTSDIEITSVMLMETLKLTLERALFTFVKSIYNF